MCIYIIRAAWIQIMIPDDGCTNNILLSPMDVDPATVLNSDRDAKSLEYLYALRIFVCKHILKSEQTCKDNLVIIWISDHQRCEHTNWWACRINSASFDQGLQALPISVWSLFQEKSFPQFVACLMDIYHTHTGWPDMPWKFLPHFHGCFRRGSVSTHAGRITVGEHLPLPLNREG